MRHLNFFVIFALVAFFAGGTVTAEALEIPGRTPYKINDFAQVIDDDVEKELETLLNQLERDTKRNIEVIVQVFMSLEGMPFDSFMEQASRTLRTGPDDKDNRVLIFVFLADNRMNIGVGEGVIDILSDERARQIMMEKILPAFTVNDITGGINDGVREIESILRAEKSLNPVSAEANRRRLIRAFFAGIVLLLLWKIFLNKRSSKPTS